MGNNRNLSIVHINSHDMPGGAAKVASRLVEAQQKAGHQAKMLVGHKSGETDYSLLFDSNIDKSLQKICCQRGQLFYEYQGSHELINNKIVQSADILHLHNLHGSYFNPFSIPSLSRIKPLIWTLHDMQAFTGHCAHSFDCSKWLTGCGECPDLSIYPDITVDATAQLWSDKKLIYDHAGFLLVAPSLWLKNKVERSILRDHPVELIYNGIDTNAFRPYNKLEARRKFGIPENALVVGSVASGSILSNVWKGGSFTIEALNHLWQKYSNLLFVNVGSDSQINDSRILSIPHIDSEPELAEAYSTLDIFMYTSLADNCPLVVIEALSCGIPIVAFNTGGVPELVRNGCDGFVAGYKNVDELSYYIEKLLDDSILRERFGQAARESAVDRFDHGVISGQYEQLYYQLIKDSGSFKRTKRIPLLKVPEIIKSEVFVKAENPGLSANLETKNVEDDEQGTGFGRDVARKNRDEQSLLLSGQKLFNNGDFVKAEKCFSMLLEFNNRSQPALYGLALCARKKKCVEDALKYLNEILTLNSKHVEAYNQAGIIAFEVNDLASAKVFFESALKIDNGFIDSLRNLGRVLFSLGDYKKAVSTFIELLKRTPDDVFTLLSLTELYIKIDRNRDAIKILNRILELEPNNAEAKIVLQRLTF